MPVSPKRIENARYGGQVGSVIEALGDLYEPREALSWLVSPQPLLGGKVPADLLLTEEGSAEVVRAVSQLQDSVHA